MTGPEVLRALEDGIEITPRPFAAAAAKAGTDEATVIDALKAMMKDGTLRSFGAVVDHRALGFHVNAMVVWDVPDADVERAGRALAAMPMVSHCYERRRVPGRWDHNLFTMVHARDEAELEGFLRVGGEVTAHAPCQVLRTVKELRKTGVRL